MQLPKVCHAMARSSVSAVTFVSPSFPVSVVRSVSPQSRIAECPRPQRVRASRTCDDLGHKSYSEKDQNDQKDQNDTDEGSHGTHIARKVGVRYRYVVFFRLKVVFDRPCQVLWVHHHHEERTERVFPFPHPDLELFSHSHGPL